MRVAVCVDGSSTEALLDAAAVRLATDAVWVAVHVVDARPRRELGLLRGGITGAGPLSHSQQRAIDAATGEHTRTTLADAERALQQRGLAYEAPQIRVGEPGREICHVANAIAADVVVLFASRTRRGEVGPHSVGHTARFVVDHAPCAVLLVRGGG